MTQENVETKKESSKLVLGLCGRPTGCTPKGHFVEYVMRFQLNYSLHRCKYNSGVWNEDGPSEARSFGLTD